MKPLCPRLQSGAQQVPVWPEIDPDLLYLEKAIHGVWWQESQFWNQEDVLQIWNLLPTSCKIRVLFWLLGRRSVFPDFPPENHLSSTSSPGDSGKCALSPEARSGHVTKRQPIRTLHSPPTLLPIVIHSGMRKLAPPGNETKLWILLGLLIGVRSQLGLPIRP